MVIYKVTNSVDGKVYIGQTKRPLKQRLYQHFYYATSEKYPCNYPLQVAIREHGKDCFSAEILFKCEKPEDMDGKEQEYIHLYNSLFPNGYNLRDGGLGSSQHWTTIEKMKIINRGRVVSPETRKKIGDANRGNVWNQESRLRASIAQTGRIHSEETKQKMSKTAIEMDRSQAKFIIHTRTGRIFASMVEASVFFGCNVSAFRKGMNHKLEKYADFQYM